MGSYKDLRVWHEAIDLVVQIYAATGRLPRAEMFGLQTQMRKAAVSIPSNVAEGQGRETTPDYRRFVISARGSLLELETQIEICERLGFSTGRSPKCSGPARNPSAKASTHCCVISRAIGHLTSDTREARTAQIPVTRTTSSNVVIPSASFRNAD